MAKLAIRGGAPVRSRPFGPYPAWDDGERQALMRTLESGDWGGFPEPNTRARQLARRFAAAHDARHGISCANGSVSIEVALRAAGIKAGDEVITTPYTWIATAASAVHLNAVPVFADIDPDTYCIDPAAVEERITSKTRAIIPVHLGSQIADMDRLSAISEAHGLFLVEDCAHAHGARWRERGVGSLGHFGSFSFQSSKLMTAGEGGMILTNDDELAQKCHCLVNCGRKEPGYDSFEGELFGWNNRISDLQAAVLLAQLDKLPALTVRRSENATHLAELLEDVEGITPLPRDERITTQAHYQLILKYDSAAWRGLHRDRFLAALTHEGIDLDGTFYIPIPDSPLFNVTADEWPMIRTRYGDTIRNADIGCPVATKASYEEAIWMHYPYLMGTREDIEDIVEAIVKIRDNLDEIL